MHLPRQDVRKGYVPGALARIEAVQQLLMSPPVHSLRSLPTKTEPGLKLCLLAPGAPAPSLANGRPASCGARYTQRLRLPALEHAKERLLDHDMREHADRARSS